MIFLSDQEREQLKAQHRTERDGRIRDRIKAVLLYDKGWSTSTIAEALLLSDDAIRSHISEYKESKKLKPENGGSTPKLSLNQSQHLIDHLREHTYLYVKVRHEVAQILVVAKQQLQILLCNSTRIGALLRETCRTEQYRQSV